MPASLPVFLGLLAAPAQAAPVPSAPSAQVVPPPAPRSPVVNHLLGRLETIERKSDSKCWATQLKIEDYISQYPIDNEAVFAKVRLLEVVARDLFWMAPEFAQGGKVRRESVDQAYKAYFRLEPPRLASLCAWNSEGKTPTPLDAPQLQLPLPSSGTLLAELPLPETDRKVSIYEFDIETYRKTTMPWKVLLSVLQTGRQPDLSSWELEAVDRVADLVALNDIVMLKFGPHLARLDGFSAVGAGHYRLIDRVLRKNVATTGWQGLTGRLDFRGEARANSIYYIYKKLQILQGYNKVVPEEELRRRDERIAGLPVAEEAWGYYRKGALSNMLTRLWREAERRTREQGMLLVSGESMQEAILKVLPHRYDASQNLVLFPGTPDERTYLEPELDAMRDDTVSLRLLFGRARTVGRKDGPAGTRLEHPLDVWAIEALAEMISNYEFILLERAGALARKRGAAVASLAEVREAEGFYLAPHPSAPRTDSAGARSSSSAKPYAGIFSEVASEAGLKRLSAAPTEGYSLLVGKVANGGVALGDLDGDGRPDAVFFEPRGEKVALFRNEGGTFRRKARLKPSSSSPNNAFVRGGLSTVDYDNDGDLDLLAVGYTWTLWRNDGRWRFKDVTARAGLKAPGPQSSSTALWGDYDKDGFLDLYIVNFGDLVSGRVPTLSNARNGEGNRLFRNDGRGGFTDVTQESGTGDTGWGFGGHFLDFDLDGWQDIMVFNDFGEDVLYRNVEGRRFVNVAREMGVRDYGAGMGLSVADYDGDGKPDLFVTNITAYLPRTSYIRPTVQTPMKLGERFVETMLRVKQADHMYLNRWPKPFEEVTQRLLQPAKRGWGWGGFFFDFDNDGYQDLYYPNGFLPDKILYHDEKDVLYRQNPATGVLEDVSEGSGVDLPANARGSATADIDGDGDLDIVLQNVGSVQVLRNNAERLGRHWLRVRLEGSRSNRMALGAVVRLLAGGRWQTGYLGAAGGGFKSSSEPVLHFGLGGAAKAQRLEILWPSGRKTVLEGVDADRTVDVREPAPGSLP